MSVERASGASADLTALPDGGPVRLTGGWMARPGRPDERPDAVAGEPLAVEGEAPGTDALAWRRVEMPATFRAQDLAAALAPGAPLQDAPAGVWYRLPLRLDAQRPMRGVLPPLSSAYRLYAVQPSGRVDVLAEGGAALGPDRWHMRQTFSLPAGRDVTLVWFIAASPDPLAGPYRVPRVGEAGAVVRDEMRHVALIFVTLGALAVLMLASLVVWRRRPDDLRPFALTLLAGVLALRTLAGSDVADVLVPVWTGSTQAMLDAMTLFLLLAGMGLLTWTFFPIECAPLGVRRWRLLPPVLADEPTARRRAPKALRHAVTASVAAAWVIGLGGALAALVVADAASSPLVRALQGAMVLPLVGLGGAVASAAVFGRRGARAVAVGAWIALSAAVHDVLVAVGSLPGTDPVAVYAFLAFLGLIAAAYTDVFARNARAVTDLSRVLSERVAVRTRELETASAAAQAANQAKTQFISAVSHELRTPIAAMLGYAQLLGDELDADLTPTQREFFGVIQTSGDRLIGLVSDLLDFALIESGRFEVRLGRVMLPGIVGEVVRQVAPSASERGLVVIVGEVPDVAVLADAQRLRQVLINLLSNAIKFTDHGSVTLSCAAVPMGEHEGIAIAVADTGPGIDEAFRPLLFERFTQAAATYDATQKGVGLGLAIVKELVARMHGEISVVSEPGEGATFTVVLRRAEAVENPRAA